MARATSSQESMTGTADGSLSGDNTNARRARGIALIVGAITMVALIETETIPFYWVWLLTGLTYLLAAAVGRSRGSLWGPALVLTSVGFFGALWLRDGRMPDSFQLLALAVMALGLGGVLAALLGQLRGFSISPMSIAIPVLLTGVFALLEQQMIKPVAGESWVYAGLLALWGIYELRPASKR